MKTKKKKKKGPGRPPKDPNDKSVKVSISVPPEMVGYADKHFDGSMSQLVHWLWETRRKKVKST